MIVSDTAFIITIAALKTEPRNYVIELERPGLRAIHYAVGPQNSIANTIGRICNELEIDVWDRDQ